MDRFPGLAESWDTIHRAGESGPLDGRTQRLVKLAVSMGAQRESAVRAGVRKAIAEGIPRDSVEQLVPLAAGTLGMPGAVACYSWICEAYEREASA
ncbi:MAG: carboxymuconolactone decarboxylase family protein [Gemmatimonadales bacterium]